jgi:hypothetical protein
VGVEADALAYHGDTALLGRQAAVSMLRLWQKILVGDLSASWTKLLPDAVALLMAAQTVAGELADPYLTQVLDDTGPARPVDPSGLVGPGLPDLLYEPVIRTKSAIGDGLAPRLALEVAGKQLATYALTTTADAARLAVTAGMAARPHASGYYRMLRPPSCARCAILAGKHFAWNRGFQRHPRCDCVHIPVQEADDSLAFDPRAAIEAGQVTGLSKANLKAIVEHGADPAQVVNAQAGMYDIGQFTATTTGVTRRAVAGARMLARDLDRALGIDVKTQTYTNFVFDPGQVAKWAELLRRGKTYTRLTRRGREQRYAYRYVRTPRPTPQQIVTSASSRAEAVRLLTNYGYIL